jgi:4-phosphopantoate--beta-alanine ligase
MGKTVCVIDLNPLSRTARTASVTIVDELTRCVSILLDDLKHDSVSQDVGWDNDLNLQEVISVMLRILD